MFCAGKTISDTAHIDGKDFLRTFRNGTAAAVTDFFKDCDVLVDFSRKCDMLVLQIFGITQKNGSAQLVIEETALDVAGRGDRGPRIEADESFRS